MMKWSTRGRAIALLCVGMAALVPSCSVKPDARPPNVVLITLDALRADRLSCYGYGRKTSPFIDSLAARGVVFDHCTASSCWTPPSMASICTSQYPREHGVRHGLAYEKGIHGQEMLADSFTTLAESLKARGYRTYGLSANAHFSKDTGMAQGFDVFKSFWFCGAKLLHEAALALREDLSASGPYFLWIHYLDPHAPYEARKPWITEYARHPVLVTDWENKTVEDIRAAQGRFAAEPAILETLSDLYDSDINFGDDYVRRLFDEVLPKDGNTLVIISSDHGEAFLEHGQMEHARSLFEEEIHVPLIIIPPSTKANARHVSGETSILDIYPTIIAYAGADIPTACRGRSLKATVDGAPLPPMPAFAEFDRGDPLTSIALDRWKLHAIPQSQTTLLFDLASDPSESTNVAEARLDMLERLAEEIGLWVSRTPSFDAPRGSFKLTPEQEQKMRSLGYLR